MRFTPAVTLLASLLTLSAAQTIYDLPQCAQSCFLTSVQASDCGLTDMYCQCTEGEAQIRASAVTCLCESDCTATDLLKAQQVSNGICSAALASSSETYSATAISPDVCQASGAGSGSASGTTTAASTDASATGGSSGDAAADASASASQSVETQSGNAAAPAVTGRVALQGAMMGVVGLGLMAL